MTFLAAVPVALQAAATAATVASTVMQGLSTRQAALYNANMAKQRAQQAAQAAASDAAQAQVQGERTIGTAVANAGASGFTLGGSASDVLGDLAGQQRYNTAALIYQGDLERVQALSEATMYKKQAQNAGWNTLISSIGAVMDGGYKMSQVPRG